MAVSKRVRFEVMRRDGNACRYCGAMAPEAKLTIDHVMPTALGGSDDPGNLVTACRDCNAGKTSTSLAEHLVEDVTADAMRWSAAMRLAAEQLRAERESRVAEYAVLHKRWHEWTFESGGKTYFMNGCLPDNYIEKFDTYRDVGLTVDDLLDGVRILESVRFTPKDPFAYFLGIMNNKAAELQTRARQILDQEGE